MLLIRTTTGFVISALFWDLTQRVVVVSYRRFGTTYRALEGGTDRLYRKSVKKLPLDHAKNPKRAGISFKLRRKPEITDRVCGQSSRSTYFTVCMSRE